MNNLPARFKLIVGGVAFAALFVAVALWGGVPPRPRWPGFAAGLVVLLGALFAFAAAAGYLLWRPLPRGRRVSREMWPAPYRRLLATVIAIAGISLVVGGFWDEVWHRKYGIPFGEDLFWRPHLLIYGSIALIVGLAAVALIALVRRGEGSVQARFRADPVLGMLVLVGAFMGYALPADPIWHVLYGEDISGWSLPHIILTAAFTLVLLLAAAIGLTTHRARRWGRLRALAYPDALSLLVFAFVLNINLQVLTTDWDGAPLHLLQMRPAWLLPAVLATLAALVGGLALHSLRFAGAATATGVLALLLRLGLLRIFAFDAISPAGWIAVLPPLIALDLAYGTAIARSGRPPRLRAGIIAALAGVLAGTLPLADRLYATFTLEAAGLPALFLAVALAAAGAFAAGRATGNYMATANKQTEMAAEATPRWLRLVPPAAFVLVLLVIVGMIATAAPPV